jgi:hypothetical protein
MNYGLMAKARLIVYFQIRIFHGTLIRFVPHSPLWAPRNSWSVDAKSLVGRCGSIV